MRFRKFASLSHKDNSLPMKASNYFLFTTFFFGTNNIHLSAIIPVANGRNISGDTLQSSCDQSRFLKDSARCGQSHLLKSNLSNIFVGGLDFYFE